MQIITVNDILGNPHDVEAEVVNGLFVFDRLQIPGCADQFAVMAPDGVMELGRFLSPEEARQAASEIEILPQPLRVRLSEANSLYPGRQGVIRYRRDRRGYIELVNRVGRSDFFRGIGWFDPSAYVLEAEADREKTFPVRLHGPQASVLITLPEPMGGSAKLYLREVAKGLPAYREPIVVAITGRSEEGEAIPIDTVGKWLFGVPGYAGHIQVSNWKGVTCEVQYPKESPHLVHQLVATLQSKVEDGDARASECNC